MAGDRKSAADRIGELAWDIVKAVVQGSVLYLLAAPAGVIRSNPRLIAIAVTVVTTVIMLVVATALTDRLAPSGVTTIAGWPAPIVVAGVIALSAFGTAQWYRLQFGGIGSTLIVIAFTSTVAMTSLALALRGRVLIWLREQERKAMEARRAKAKREELARRRKAQHEYLERPWG